MAYQEQQGESKRVVVETPNSRREVVRSESILYPDRSGISGTALAAIVVGVIALAAIIILFAMNRRDTVNANFAQQPPQTTIVQQPAQQPPSIIVQQPAPATQPAPVIINGQPAPAAGGTTTSSGPDDLTIQTAIDKKFNDDPNLSSLGITATVLNGKVTLLGSVKTEQMKAQVERVVQNVKGVKSVDNQISVG
jgi:uncharacterized integral membrane protein